MKISKHLLLSIFIISLLTACGNSGQNSAKKIDITAQQLSSTVDPVCKMSLEQHAIADTTTYQGKLYGFCNSGCKESFLQDPAKYISGL